jgi:gas vesicle protein
MRKKDTHINIELMENILFVVIGIFVGALIGWIVAQGRASQREKALQQEVEAGRAQMTGFQREIAVWEEKSRSLGIQAEELRKELSGKIAENMDLITEVTSLREQQIALKEKLEEHLG